MVIRKSDKKAGRTVLVSCMFRIMKVLLIFIDQYREVGDCLPNVNTISLFYYQWNCGIYMKFYWNSIRVGLDRNETWMKSPVLTMSEIYYGH